MAEVVGLIASVMTLSSGIVNAFKAVEMIRQAPVEVQNLEV
jgi:hypothetical protein